MLYAENILPKDAAYYTLSNAVVENDQIRITAPNGYAEIQLTEAMLASITGTMLITVHPSLFSDSYKNDCIQVELTIITTSGSYVDVLVPVSYSESGVFNSEVTLPEGSYALYSYKILSAVPVTIYNWELCPQDSADLSVVIDGIEQTLPKLLYDFNSYAYAVGQSEQTVGLITCYLQSPTDLQGHFTISFFATERCNVHVRIKDNNVSELFSPQVYTVEQGYASVSIPHAYLKKKASDHSFAVTMQCTSGQLSVPVRGVLYTIDGGYLATRLLDAGIDVQDISIRQLPSDTSPSEIWAVGFEGIRLLLKKRAYNRLNRVNWTAIKDFGEGKQACVEFNGSWSYNSQNERATLYTDTMPFVFILDNEGNLKAYTGTSYNDVFVLDTGVDQVSACRGYNSMYDISNDQGLLVAYVKDDNVYYRQYLYNTDISGYMWYPIETLYDVGDATFVSTHRLPDYRFGLCVSHAEGTKWYITDRTWVGQGIKQEFINTFPNAFSVMTVIDASRVDEITGVATQNEFTEGLWFNGFEMTFMGDLIFAHHCTLQDLQFEMEVYVNDVLQDFDFVKDIVIEGPKMTVIMKEDIRGSSTVLIKYNCPYLVTTAYNGCYVVLTQEYSWQLPAPTIRVVQEEDISVGVTPSVTIEVKERLILTHSQEETLGVDVNPTLDLEVIEVNKHTEPVEEPLSVSAAPTVSIVVTQTGVTPV